jgi:lysophospholipase L1-like esterase
MDKLLFLGDSLTDAFHSYDSDGLGEGYVRRIAESLHYGQGGVSVTNKGIDGFTLPLLLRLWKNECTSLSPDAISVLIGVNDASVIRLNSSGNESLLSAALDDFRIGFLALIEEIRKTCTACPIFILEPFIFSKPAEYTAWRPLLEELSRIERTEAERAGLHFLPLQAKLDRAAETEGIDRITVDGIHLTEEGHAILADTWLRAWRVK